MRMLAVLSTILAQLCLVIALSASPVAAQGYDPQAPCGRDANGIPYPCNRPDPNASQEAACLTLARLENCLPYHYRACAQGFQAACVVYSYGQHCNGGDPNNCNYYMTILAQNRACGMNNDQNACAWLRQQGF